MSDRGSPSIDRSSRVCRRPAVLATEVEGEVVMMDMERGLYFGLDAVGTCIWKSLETPLSVAELVTALNRKYVGEADTIERDVIELLSRLAEQGLVDVG